MEFPIHPGMPQNEEPSRNDLHPSVIEALFPNVNPHIVWHVNIFDMPEDPDSNSIFASAYHKISLLLREGTNSRYLKQAFKEEVDSSSIEDASFFVKPFVLAFYNNVESEFRETHPTEMIPSRVLKLASPYLPEGEEGNVNLAYHILQWLFQLGKESQMPLKEQQTYVKELPSNIEEQLQQYYQQLKDQSLQLQEKILLSETALPQSLVDQREKLEKKLQILQESASPRKKLMQLRMIEQQATTPSHERPPFQEIFVPSYSEKMPNPHSAPSSVPMPSKGSVREPIQITPILRHPKSSGKEIVANEKWKLYEPSGREREPGLTKSSVTRVQPSAVVTPYKYFPNVATKATMDWAVDTRRGRESKQGVANKSKLVKTKKDEKLEKLQWETDVVINQRLRQTLRDLGKAVEKYSTLHLEQPPALGDTTAIISHQPHLFQEAPIVSAHIMSPTSAQQQFIVPHQVMIQSPMQQTSTQSHVYIPEHPTPLPHIIIEEEPPSQPNTIVLRTQKFEPPRILVEDLPPDPPQQIIVHKKAKPQSQILIQEENVPPESIVVRRPCPYQLPPNVVLQEEPSPLRQIVIRPENRLQEPPRIVLEQVPYSGQPTSHQYYINSPLPNSQHIRVTPMVSPGMPQRNLQQEETTVETLLRQQNLLLRERDRLRRRLGFQLEEIGENAVARGFSRPNNY